MCIVLAIFFFEACWNGSQETDTHISFLLNVTFYISATKCFCFFLQPLGSQTIFSVFWLLFFFTYNFFIMIFFKFFKKKQTHKSKQHFFKATGLFLCEWFSYYNILNTHLGCVPFTKEEVLLGFLLIASTFLLIR